MTLTQKHALEHYWNVYGLTETDHLLDFIKIFGRNAPTFLEIGFGMGASLIQLAMQHPEVNFIGMEVHRPGIGSLLSAIQSHRIHNIRILCADAKTVLNNVFPDQSLKGILLFFPDPWPKRKHHKRRLVQTEMVELIYQKLVDQGYFHMATDVSDYADYATVVMKSHDGFHPMTQGFSPEILCRPKTKYELRGEKRGHVITELIYQKR